MLFANNKQELKSALSSMDISVPKRSDGRTKAHTERFAIAHMLSALLAKNKLAYPLGLIQRERPDFLLRINDSQIGIEHTEAIPQNEAHKTVLRDKVAGPDFYLISHHYPSENKQSAKELIEEIQANKAGPAWAGDAAEKEWSEVMLHFVKKKIEAMSKEGFEIFGENWLLIYDNWILPALAREKAANLLLPKINECACFDSFDSVYIITGNLVLVFSNGAVVQHEVNNLWN